MRRLVALLAVLTLVGAASAYAARGGGRVPPFPRLAGQWSHAEINVTIHRQQHTLILDRGRIVQASPSQISIRRLDGTPVTIPLVRRTIVTLDGFRVFPRALARGEAVETMEIDQAPAVRVRAQTR